MKYTIGCIGCGNMGGALVRALAKIAEKGTLAVCDTHIEKTARLADECGVVVTDATDIAKHAKYVMIGVKPQVFFDTLDSIKAALSENPDVILISMAAAISMHPVSMDELTSVADAGEIMPPKSTWFEPKLRSGILIHKI